MMSDDKPRIRWSATEIVGIGIDSIERIRKTKDGKTVLMPTVHSKERFQVWENEDAYSVPVQFAEEVAAFQGAAGGEE
jgi:hypothetical protein